MKVGYLLKVLQRIFSAKEMKNLNNGEKIPKSSHIICLNTFIEEKRNAGKGGSL